MTSLSRRSCIIAAGIASGAAIATAARSIDDFFDDFTADWIRRSPNQATGARYFSGEEQDRLERRLTPQTLAFSRERIQLARQGIVQLAKFNRTSNRNATHFGRSHGMATE